jgi:aspartyl-tRNA(Asn)/glutamyl-tRNA(Gln) amidotransferase subunit A
MDNQSIDELRGMLINRDVSVREVTEAALQRIHQENGRLHAVITVVESALERADELDRSDTVRRDLPLFGIPFTIKDIMTVEGIRCTCGSAARMTAPPSSVTADAVEKAQAAGAVLIATANLHEWAGGPNSKNRTFGEVVNPSDENLTPGGSSGGSGAAVAAGMGLFSLGTDTGGSSRIPASCNGVAAWKPTKGMISTRGVFPVAPTLDTVGPLARGVDDLRFIMDAYLSADAPDAERAVRRVRLGIEESYFFDPSNTSQMMTQPVRDLLQRAEGAGFDVVPVSVPALRWAMSTETVIMLGEWASAHGHGIRGQRHLYGDDIQRFLRLGDAVSAEFYLDARRVRALIQSQLYTAFETVDALVSPTFPCQVPGKDQTSIEWSPLLVESVMEATWRFTLPANLAGLPAVVFPLGQSTSLRSIPASVQLLGAPGSDRKIQAMASQLSKLYGDMATAGGSEGSSK